MMLIQLQQKWLLQTKEINYSIKKIPNKNTSLLHTQLNEKTHPLRRFTNLYPILFQERSSRCIGVEAGILIYKFPLGPLLKILQHNTMKEKKVNIIITRIMKNIKCPKHI